MLRPSDAPPGPAGCPRSSSTRRPARSAPARIQRRGCASSCCSGSRPAARSPTSAAAPARSRWPPRALGWDRCSRSTTRRAPSSGPRRNAELNGLAVEAVQADLTASRRRPRRRSPPTSRPAVASPRSPRDSRRRSSTCSLSGVVEPPLPDMLGAYGAAGIDPIERAAARWQRAAAGATPVSLLDPAAATRPIHGQLASGLPDGGLASPATSSWRMAPARRCCRCRGCSGSTCARSRTRCRSRRVRCTRADPLEHGGAPFTDYGKAEEPRGRRLLVRRRSRADPLAGRVSLASTLDRESGVTHFVAHAVVREVPLRDYPHRRGSRGHRAP